MEPPTEDGRDEILENVEPKSADPRSAEEKLAKLPADDVSAIIDCAEPTEDELESIDDFLNGISETGVKEDDEAAKKELIDLYTKKMMELFGDKFKAITKAEVAKDRTAVNRTVYNKADMKRALNLFSIEQLKEGLLELSNNSINTLYNPEIASDMLIPGMLAAARGVTWVGKQSKQKLPVLRNFDKKLLQVERKRGLVTRLAKNTYINNAPSFSKVGANSYGQMMMLVCAILSEPIEEDEEEEELPRVEPEAKKITQAEAPAKNWFDQ